MSAAEACALGWTVYANGNAGARCGSRHQGVAMVLAVPLTGAWVWWIDMLPDDSEAVIYGAAHRTRQAAMAEAERQAAQWPVLVAGARR